MKEPLLQVHARTVSYAEKQIHQQFMGKRTLPLSTSLSESILRMESFAKTATRQSADGNHFRSVII
jgi:hypothetical protein